jgi:hypothetical protein
VRQFFFSNMSTLDAKTPMEEMQEFGSRIRPHTD